MKKTTLLSLLMAVGCATGGNGAPCNPPRCDLDGDGKAATAKDADAFLAALGSHGGGPKFNALADVDGSGTVTTADFAILKQFCHFAEK